MSEQISSALRGQKSVWVRDHCFLITWSYYTLRQLPPISILTSDLISFYSIYAYIISVSRPVSCDSCSQTFYVKVEQSTNQCQLLTLNPPAMNAAGDITWWSDSWAQCQDRVTCIHMHVDQNKQNVDPLINNCPVILVEATNSKGNLLYMNSKGCKDEYICPTISWGTTMAWSHQHWKEQQWNQFSSMESKTMSRSV